MQFSNLFAIGAFVACVAPACDSSTDPDFGGDNGLTYGSDPTPLPALEPIAFDSLGRAGRLVFARISSDGRTSGVQVIDVAARTSWGFAGEVYEAPAVSPNGQIIAFTTLSQYSAATPNHFYDLYAVDAQGNNLRKLSANDGQDRSPSWSPDGAELLYMVAGGLQTDVYKRPANGDAALKQRVQVDFQCVDVKSPLDISVTRRMTFAAAACTNSTSPVQGYGIFVAEANGSGIKRLIGGTTFPTTKQYYSPAWSPDGNRIAFLELGSDPTGGEQPGMRVRVMDAGGTNLRTLVDLPLNNFNEAGTFSGGNVYSLAWSPDGGRIAFNHAQSPLVFHIYVVRADGTGLTRITSAAATDRSLSWSD